MHYLLLTRELAPGRPGGVASWSDDLARALHAAGRRVTVLVERRGAAETVERPYAVVPVRGRSWAKYQGLWMALASAAWVRRRDVVVLSATWPLATLLPFRRVPLLVGAHGSDVTRLESATAPFRRVAQRAHWLPVSSYLAGELQRLGVPPGRVHPLPWPIVPTNAPPQPGRSLVMVARLVHGKGLRDALLLASRLEMPLEVVGDGPCLKPMQALARTMGVQVTWHGARSRAEARAVIAEAAAVVLLSTADSKEGLGLTALEAAAAGVPSIGRDVGGVREAVGPGVVLARHAELATVDLSPVRALLADPTAGARSRDHLVQRHGPRACLHRIDQLVTRCTQVEVR